VAGTTLSPSFTTSYLPRHAGGAGARLPRFLLDAVVVLSMIGLYFLGRGIAPDRVDDAVALSVRLVELEQRLHIFVEPAIQEVSIRHYWVQELANFIYAYLHFPALAVVGVWLWWRGRERFVFMRNVMFVSMVIGLVFYYALPAAPPRLMAAYGYDLGFVDTVFGGNTSVSYAQPSLIRNDFAAIPSFHFGWIALASLALWVNTRSRVLRTVAVALSGLMTWAIIASANHYFMDMALGGLVIAASWFIAGRLRGGAAPRGSLVPLPDATLFGAERLAA
jgi:PAP2 superfamily